MTQDLKAQKLEELIFFNLRQLLLHNLRKLIEKSGEPTLLYSDFDKDFKENWRYKQLQEMQYQVINDPYALSIIEMLFENIYDKLPKGFYEDKNAIPTSEVLDAIDEMLALTIDEIK